MRTRIVLAASVLTALCLTSTTLTAATAAPAATDVGTSSRPDRNVTIKRDTYGVPHVYARTTRGLFLGYGYAVGQDRLFQMEMARRAVLGTTAEVLGPGYLPVDRSARSSFDPAAIRAQIDRLPAHERSVLEGYAAGMNRRIAEVEASPGTLLPREFTDFGFRPTTWTAYDVAMIFVGTMANRYSDFTSELTNFQMRQSLISAYGTGRGNALFNQLMWTEDPTAPTTVPRSSRGASASSPVTPPLRNVSPGLKDDGVERMRTSGGGTWPAQKPEASNFWAIGRQKNTDQGSVLMNGPQFSWFNPSYVYAIGLHGAGYDVTGNTPFGYPAILFGTNRTTSWGSTAGPLDVNDVYQERLDPSDQHRYYYDGAWHRMGVRTETIAVAGAAPVTAPVYSTVHGTVTSVDAANGTAYSKKRSWTGTEVQSLMAWVEISRSSSWGDFLKQARRVGITINWYYADKRGNIGYVSPGRIPIRPANQDPRVPAAGDGSMEWQGFEPFERNPQTYNPPQGYIANWNNQSAPGFNVGANNWSPVDRVNEITARLRSKQRLSARDMWNINEQTSFADLNIRYLRPFLARATRALPATDPVARAARLLLHWDGQTRDRDGDGTLDGPQPALMRAWLPVLFDTVLKDDLPASVYASYAFVPTSARPAEAMKLVYNALLGRRAGVNQSVDFFNGADRDAVLRSTLATATRALTSAHGADPGRWAVVPTTPLVFSTVNFLGAPQTTPDRQVSLPFLMNRGTQNDLVTLSPRGASMCTVAPPGQSGFIAPDGTPARHTRDQLALYASFRCKPERLTPRQVDQHRESTQTLRGD